MNEWSVYFFSWEEWEILLSPAQWMDCDELLLIKYFIQRCLEITGIHREWTRARGKQENLCPKKSSFPFKYYKICVDSIIPQNMNYLHILFSTDLLDIAIFGEYVKCWQIGSTAANPGDENCNTDVLS